MHDMTSISHLIQLVSCQANVYLLSWNNGMILITL